MIKNFLVDLKNMDVEEALVALVLRVFINVQRLDRPLPSSDRSKWYTQLQAMIAFGKGLNVLKKFFS
jgi:hypothetical protein